jgi:hypothetical protein
MYLIHEDLARAHMRELRQEADHERLLRRARRVRRARRAREAGLRVRRALARALAAPSWR